MKSCPRCNAPNDDATVSCQYCGITFPPAPVQPQPNVNPQTPPFHNYYQQAPNYVSRPMQPIVPPQYYSTGFTPYPQQYPPMMLYPSAPDPNVLKNQQKIQKIITFYAQYGYKVTFQTDTTAQLTKEKSFSCFLAVLLLILWVFPFIIYLIYYDAKKEDRLLVTLNPDGSTSFTFNDNDPITNRPINGETKLPVRDDSSVLIALVVIGIIISVIVFALNS